MSSDSLELILHQNVTLIMVYQPKDKQLLYQMTGMMSSQFGDSLLLVISYVISYDKYYILFCCRDNEIHCILWGEHVNQFEEFMAKHNGELTIVVFQLARVKVYEGTAIS